jgi:hypothetical protein
MQVFTIAPSTTRPLWVLVPVGLILIGVVAALAISAVGARRATFQVAQDGLRIRGDFYGRQIAAEHLRISEARRVNLLTSPDLRPGMRTLGTGLPGYQAGWFRLRNGSRALVYLTDRTKGVLIPTTLGYDVLLSPDQPDAFLSALSALNGTR